MSNSVWTLPYLSGNKAAKKWELVTDVAELVDKVYFSSKYINSFYTLGQAIGFLCSPSEFREYDNKCDTKIKGKKKNQEWMENKNENIVGFIYTSMLWMTVWEIFIFGLIQNFTEVFCWFLQPIFDMWNEKKSEFSKNEV